MKPFTGLLVGGRETFSLGRVGFWLVFGLSIYFWLVRPVEAFPSSLENTLGFMLAYNLGGKAVNTFGGRRNKRQPERRYYDNDIGDEED